MPASRRAAAHGNLADVFAARSGICRGDNCHHLISFFAASLRLYVRCGPFSTIAFTA